MKFSELKDGELPLPPGINKKFMSDERSCKRFGEIVTVFDPTTLVGGCYHLGKREWTLWWPIDHEAFSDRVAHGIASYEKAQMAEKPDTVN